MTPPLSVRTDADIPAAYAQCPIGDLVRFHNLATPLVKPQKPELLIGMCMDSRNVLRMPENFAFILRAGGANLKPSEFKVSYSIAVGGVRAIALIGHTQCGMVDLEARRQLFVEGLVAHAGWDKAAAEKHFDEDAPTAEIKDSAAFVASEAVRLRTIYPRITVAPLLYKVEDNKLYFVAE